MFIERQSKGGNGGWKWNNQKHGGGWERIGTFNGIIKGKVHLSLIMCGCCQIIN